MKIKFHTVIVLILGSLGLLTSCSSSQAPTLKVAATSVPHTEILEIVEPDLKKQQIQLEIVTVEDFNTPNRALQDKEVDANFFQHQPFLDAQKTDFGYQLESLAAIHLEPMGLYSKKIKSLNELKNGATIAIPSDPTNQARALALCQQTGLIRLKRQDAKATVLDIAENPKQIKFIEIDSPLLSRALEDVDAAAISTNFALQAGLSPQKDILAIEDAQSLFVNVLVIRSGDEQRADLQALKAALTSDKVKDFINSRYEGAILPAF
ncbi:MetQ/NlpA family ABC transporter substrate-binding protein [Candidatus Protochlamydia phocaeensis]|uniref:MetQ/NlpA family ABC transporter substrate-binding protein n=1 Tax=Candidatus Protochlamydia phocaeensis TaxID=1414722 RepID=UPI0008394797|nr:MetQ/NlpA family ABC transporter substrate-binding protein [Candidatus Protochlamydia phocaeensis]